MARPVELTPLVCAKCGFRLPARPGETAWACPNCRQGMTLSLRFGLLPVDIYYQAGIAANQTGKPFWVADGQVQVQRQTYSGNQEREAEAFWSQPRRFFVPAYSLPLEELLALGVQMLRRPPPLQKGAPVSFIPATLALEDVRAVAEFIVMAIEAERKDKLKEVHLQVTLSDPDLWILP